MASSGQVSDKKYIGEEKAREIALAKVPGGRVVKAEYDMEDGRIVYGWRFCLTGWSMISISTLSPAMF